MFKFQLGDIVKDTVTPFKGMVVARTEWLNGCIRYVVQPQELKDGKPIEGESIDEGQLMLVEEAALRRQLKQMKEESDRNKVPVDEKPARTGGPFPSVTRGQSTPKL